MALVLITCHYTLFLWHPGNKVWFIFDGSSPHWNSIAFKAVAAATPEVIFITAINTLNDFRCQRPLFFFQGLLLDKWSQLLKKMFFCFFNFWRALRKIYIPSQRCVWYFIHVGKPWLTEIQICEHKQQTLSKNIPHPAIVFACSYNLFATRLFCPFHRWKTLRKKVVERSYLLPCPDLEN